MNKIIFFLLFERKERGKFWGNPSLIFAGTTGGNSTFKEAYGLHPASYGVDVDFWRRRLTLIMITGVI